MAKREDRGQAAPVPGAPTGEVASGDEAANEAWAPISFGEGARVGGVGDSGAGKSTALRALIAAWLKKCPGVVLVIDDKGPTQRFPGQARRDVADLRAHPADPNGSRVIVFRGDCFAGYKVDREEVAALAWKIVGRRQRCLLVLDELKEAASYGQWKRGAIWLPRSFSQGREVGLSVLWGTQDVQEVPAEAFNQSSSLLVFKLGGNGLRLLDRRGYLTPEAEVAISALPGDEVPPAERGYFVHLRRGKPWSGKRSRFDATT